MESKKEELDEIKEEFDEKTEIINKIRTIEVYIYIYHYSLKIKSILFND